MDASAVAGWKVNDACAIVRLTWLMRLRTDVTDWSASRNASTQRIVASEARIRDEGHVATIQRLWQFTFAVCSHREHLSVL